MTEACVLHIAGSKSPRGSGWGVVVRTAAGQVLAKSSGGEPGASSYHLELIALRRGLGDVPAGVSRIQVRLNGTLAAVCAALLRDGVLPRKAKHPELLEQVKPLLARFEVEWVDPSKTERDDWDKDAKKLAQGAAVAGEPAPEKAASVDAAPARGGVVAFTDGGCRGNPGPGGWGFLLVDVKTQAALERRGGEPHTTNNRMEMTAAIRALEAVKREGEKVEVRSDSKYLVEMCSRWIRTWKSRGWKRKDKGEIQNLDLVKRLDELIARHDVRWTWVRGHAGDLGNEHVDRLANAAMDLLARGVDAAAERRYGPGQSPIQVVAGAAAT